MHAARAQIERRGPVLVLLASLLLATAMLVALGWGMTFFQDTWAFLLDRQSFSTDSFLAPHNEHIVVVPVAITKLLLAVFGMTSNTPEQVAMGISLLAAATLLFVYVRRRVDPWLAAMAAALLLFLGAAWPIILWPFENEFTIPIAAGLGMLVLLDREDERGDAWACAALLLAVLSGSLGISFVIAAAVDVALKHRERGWRRAYVFLLPGLVYLGWYAGWGHDAENHVTLRNIIAAPHYVMDGFASALDSLAGLSTIPVNSPGQPDWGRPLLIGAIALVALGQWRRPGFSRGFWVAAAAALSYWMLAAFNYIPGREAAASRYVYAGAVFVLLIAAELLRNVRFGRRGLIVAAVVTLCAIGPNLAQMKDGRDWLKGQTTFTRSDLAALEIARGHVDPRHLMYSVEETGTASLGIVEAGKYFEAVDRWGSPAYTPAELLDAPAPGPHYADIILGQQLPLGTETRLGLYDSGRAAENCVVLPAGSVTPASETRLSPGVTRIELAPGPHAGFSLRRFASGEYPVVTEGADGESTTFLRVPRDHAPQVPWFLHVEASQEARVCR
jgi:hypothetical protein